MLDCGECGAPICLSPNLERQRRDDGGTFYCPNGHARVFLRDDDRTRAQLVAEVKRLARRSDTLDRLLGNAHDLQQALQEELRTCPLCDLRVPYAVVAGRRSRRMRQHLEAAHGAREAPQRALEAVTGEAQ